MPDENRDIPIASAVLDYATYDADGLPPWVAPAEELIAARAKPKTIRKFFRKTEEAVKYFAKSMRRRFSLANVGDDCVACGTSPCPTVVGVQWMVRMPLKWKQIKLSNDQPRAKFVTHHAMCPACLERWSRSLARIKTARMAQNIAQWTIFALIILLPRALPRNGAASAWRAVLWPTYIVVIYVGLLVLRVWSKRRTPKGIARTLPPKLQFVSIEFFDDRERLNDAAAGLPITGKA